MPSDNLSRALVDDNLASGRGEQIAIREPKRVFTYGRLAVEMERATAALRKLGVAPGERVALLMHDSVELVAAFLGAVRLGAVAVPLNALLRPRELRTLLNDCGAVEVIAAGDLAGHVDAIRGELPALRHLCAVGGAHAGQLDFSALCRAAEPSSDAYHASDGEPAFLLYSAASDPPRAVAHDHRAPLRAFALYAEAVLGLAPSDRVLATSKLYTAYGLSLGLLFPLLAGAGTFLLPSRPRPRALFDVLLAFAPTVMAATPSVYAQLLQEAGPSRARVLTSLRHAVSGGEALPLAVYERMRQRFGIELLHGFCLTDALSFVLSNTEQARRPLSVGRPLAGVEARVVGPDGATLPPQEMGALELRAPTVSGTLRSGDRFLVDEEGFFFYCGRDDDRFKVSGRWVAPTEVEGALLLHPAVWECAVIEDRDDDGLTQPHAFIVVNVDHRPSPELAQELVRLVKDEIAPHKHPRRVSFVEALPRGPDGKVQRWRLLRP